MQELFHINRDLTFAVCALATVINVAPCLLVSRTLYPIHESLHHGSTAIWLSRAGVRCGPAAVIRWAHAACRNAGSSGVQGGAHHALGEYTPVCAGPSAFCASCKLLLLPYLVHCCLLLPLYTWCLAVCCCPCIPGALLFVAALVYLCNSAAN
jgi:hypothetical protein